MVQEISYDEYRLRNNSEKLNAIKSFERQKDKAALQVLFDFARKDQDKDVRKAAVDSIVVLNDPEAVTVLQKIQSDDRDRGVRNKAKDGAKKIQQSGKPLDEISFSEEDDERASEDFRALDESEAGQSGLKVKIQEKLQYRIDKDNNLIDEEGEVMNSLTASGQVEIINNGRKDKIWAIDAILEGVDEVTFGTDEEQGTAVFGNSFSLKELGPQDSKFVPFNFTIDQPKLKVNENFWDAEDQDSERPPAFSRGEETEMRFVVTLTNEFDWALTDVKLKKYFPDQSTTLENIGTEQGEIRHDSDSDGKFVLWEIKEIEAGTTVEASCVVKVTLDEDNDDPYMVGDTVVTYSAKEKSLSGLGLDTVNGSSSVFQFISREEQEESPGDFDCEFELENTSEFEMDLKEVRIFEGPLDEGNVRLEWLGKEFPEEERSIDPGETFKLDPWVITIEDESAIPTFGRELDLSVKYLFDSDVIAECVLPGYALSFFSIEITKAYDPLVIPSYRRTEVISEQVIKSVGNTDVMYLQLKETVPSGFELPTQDQVEILKGDQSFEDFIFEESDGALVITLEHLEESEIGAMSENDELTVKYPLYATGKPEEEYDGSISVSANVYPEVKPITKEAQAGPITVVHERRKLKIGKMVAATSSEGANEYEVILQGANDGTAVIPSVEITDFLPQGFELVGETIEDPVVGFEEHSSVNSGRAMKWVFENVEPDQKVEIRFKIKAPGEHDPKEVYKMLVG